MAERIAPDPLPKKPRTVRGPDIVLDGTPPKQHAKDGDAPKTLDGHAHYWLIESPNGHTSMGMCKHCFSTREFTNSTQSVMWEQTNTLRNDANRSLRSITGDVLPLGHGGTKTSPKFSSD
ncbi:MAG: hypothetical protein WD988_04985 [Candidatus Curtissbacteria bacterium]